METKRFNWQFLNATTLKLIAAALMFIDHIHEMFSHKEFLLYLLSSAYRNFVCDFNTCF